MEDETKLCRETKSCLLLGNLQFDSSSLQDMLHCLAFIAFSIRQFMASVYVVT